MERRSRLTWIGRTDTVILSLTFGRSRYPSDMDVLKMLADLRQERAAVEEAIVVLERLASGHGKRRGRPPAWMATPSAPERRGRPTGSKNKPTEGAGPS